MQDTDNVAQKDSGRGKAHQPARRLRARPFNRLRLRVITALPALLLCLLAPTGRMIAVAQMSHPTAPPAQTAAQKAFEKLKTLAGSWQGSLMCMSINLTLRVTSSDNAILHEATGTGRPDDPITMIYVEGERLLLTHYCDAGNRPRMEGKMSPDGKTIEFTFVDISGGTQKGYMSRIVFNINDADHHTEGGTWVLPDGRQFQAPPIEYTRKK